MMERIIAMGSNVGDLVLDPFCGSGTTLVAAESADRRWIGCDISATAISITAARLEELGLQSGRDFRIVFADQLTEVPLQARPELRIWTGLEPSIPGGSFQLSHVVPLFELGKPIRLEETRHYEFKEVKGVNAVASIKATADEYAVAFLNSEGGRIYWGVRNESREVAGVRLTYGQRDEVRRVVTEQLLNIRPSIAPTDYRLEMHQVYDGGEPIEDLVVVELVVPRVDSMDLFFTGGNETFVKTDGGRRKLNGPEIQEEIKKRIRESERGS
jgi:hypothetical protein